MNLFNKYLFILCTFFLSCTQAATVEDFSRHNKFHNVKISPDGKHLAALVDAGGGRKLIFLDTETNEITYSLNGGKKDQPGDYYWVNNERVIVQVQQLRGALEQSLNFGELFAVNFDGRKAKMIYGYRAKKGITLSGHAGFLIDTLTGDDKHVLIRKQLLSRSTDTLPQVVKLNVYNGRERRITTSPIPYSRFLIDNNSVPRFVAGVDNSHKTKLFYSAGKGEEWQPFGEDFTGEFTPLTFSADNQSIFALKTTDGGPKGLYKYNLKTQKETLLYKSDIADPSYTLKSNLREVYGLRIDEDYPNYVYLDKSNKEAQIHQALFQSFRGDNIDITSKTRDSKKIIVWVQGDRNPGDFYLFDTQTMQAKHLFNSAPWIKHQELAAVEPFRLKTPDGLTLNGYLTLPKGKDKKLPTVILPHGGPHVRDYWRYHREVQMLANAGYAVVQVNFRGSTGYGEKFEHAGYGQWGEKIQDDILLATQYAISQGIADADKVCIFGGSFGGYSALQSAIKSPDLFKCAIGYAGVYDLPMLFEEGDIPTLKWGEAYLNKTLGTDIARQKAQSPVYHVDKLKAPVLLIHGEDDLRAKIDHAEKLKAALEKHNHPFEWFVRDKEGHGFYNEDNILAANKKILAFLNKHIGS
ncbi:S9 family peptidase [Thalassomonas viridans]|uniref:S9 family peptidase n=1 Tax=Thalassomonas viridans TaxID=137584 RepID=A0AAE9Z0Q1_9GAMM|nr:S9 family peptidase [Thalassomonas viridans]WDE03889.1 S9 family peptidase [Thalassomonas viridans]